jgi:hypothetical protein
MPHPDRELRDTLERLQQELRDAKQALVKSQAEVARLQGRAAREQEGRSRAEAALAAAEARTRDADAAFQHALARLQEARQASKAGPARATPTPEGAPTRWGPRPNLGLSPDRLELWIRFGAGALAGAGVGFFTATELGLVSAAATAGLMLGSALLLGGLAWWYGDRFWRAWRLWLG